jgi:hypothetical protein
MIAFVALLSLTLALPLALGTGAYLLLRSSLEAYAAVPGTVLALGAIAVESMWLLDWLGRIFERTDPASAGISG